MNNNTRTRWKIRCQIQVSTVNFLTFRIKKLYFQSGQTKMNKSANKRAISKENFESLQTRNTTKRDQAQRWRCLIFTAFIAVNVDLNKSSWIGATLGKGGSAFSQTRRKRARDGKWQLDDNGVSRRESADPHTIWVDIEFCWRRISLTKRWRRR